MKTKLHYVFTLAVLLIGFSVFGQTKFWQKSTSNGSLNTIPISELNEKHYEVFQLDFEAFRQALVNAPLRESNQVSTTFINVPNEEGVLETFRMLEAPVFDAELSAQFPDIKSYVGVNDSGTRLRMSVSPRGVQTMISYLDKPTVFMQPVNGDPQNYIVYNRLVRGDNYTEDFHCATIDEFSKESNLDSSLLNRDANDQTLRKFRLVVSTNGEYTTYHGGTVPGALAAINASITRVNETFETDMAVTFIVIAQTTNVIYTNANTDPYSTNLGDWNLQLQNTLTNVIGNAFYDIGHMFGASGGGGNAGCIGCVCVDDTASTTDLNKGAGITSPADGIPAGDNFDIDYVAHEIGHQMGANHTFAFNTEGTGVNAEPGSGSTIMAYAGITGANNVQQHSDPYFHYHSINQILNRLVTRTCWQSNSPGVITNSPPVANAGSDYVIPRGTAYVLRGSATDANAGDVLRYCWEQTDSGNVTNTNFGPTLTSGSMNRSLPPTTSPNRYIPRLSRVIAGQLTQTNPTINSAWETVPSVARTMNWALTVRDRQPTATGLNGQTSFDLMRITVDGASGPFTVTSQTSNVIWYVGSSQTVTWNVANTNVAPVNTANVNILLSTDGGLTFPIVLASNVPNNGSYNVTVPNNVTSQARIIVEGANNIFFAANSSNFQIQTTEFLMNFASSNVTVCQPNNAVYNFTYNAYNGFSETTTFSATNVPAGANVTFSPTSASADGTPVTMTVSNIGSVAPGNYTITAVGTATSTTKTTNVTLNVFSNSLAAATLATPANGATNVPAAGSLTWNSVANAQNYLVEVATDAAFTNIVNSATVTNTTYTTSLSANTQYYWRVTASNTCATAAASSVFSFTTENVTCASYTATDTPIAISPSGANTYTSVINIAPNFPVTDVNVRINIPHTYVSDLDISLTSPNGTVVDLSSGNGGSGDNFTNTLFDQSAATLITAGSPPYTGTFRPEGNLSTINGEMSAGNWTLTVRDNFNLDGGSINEFRLDLCVQGSLGVEENEFSAFSIFPNPNNGEFTVKLNSNSGDDIRINVYDIRGRKVFNNRYANNGNFNQVIRLDDVQSGMYLINVTDGLRTETKKIIIK